MSSEQSDSAFQRMRSNPTLLLLGVIAVAALLVAAILGIMLLRSLGNESANLPPTPFPENGGQELAKAPLVEVIDGSSTISVTLDLPATLAIAGQTYALQPQVIAADGIWSPVLAEEGTAVWVYGTIVNYLIGLPNTAENQQLLEGLVPGNEFVMKSEAGVEYRFAFDSRGLVPTVNRDIFAQNVPGITLLLLGAAGDERLVVSGRYVAPEASNAEPGNVVELNETAQLDTTQVTATAATYVPNRPEAPAGFAFFLVDYRLQNTGSTAVDLNNLRLLLTDDLGNQYALSPIASQISTYPAAVGFLSSGQMLQATAGYQIPTGLVSKNFSWLVDRTDVGSQVQVIIPFNGSSAAQSAAITLQSASISADFSGIILTGQATNLGSQPMAITEREISLRTPDGSTYLMLSTNPAFPWTVGAGQTMQFTVTFQRPLAADTALFTVLNQPFELSNLR